MNYYMNIVTLVILHYLVFASYCADDKTIAAARIESCPGCSLNRLPEVKQFIYEDVPLYGNVEFKKIHGAIPELVLLNSGDEEVERLQLSKLNRRECNDLLVSKGFNKKSDEQGKSEF